MWITEGCQRLISSGTDDHVIVRSKVFSKACISLGPGRFLTSALNSWESKLVMMLHKDSIL